MVGHGGSSAGSYLADPTSPIPSHCASIVVTSTLRVNSSARAGQHLTCFSYDTLLTDIRWMVQRRAITPSYLQWTLPHLCRKDELSIPFTHHAWLPSHWWLLHFCHSHMGAFACYPCSCGFTLKLLNVQPKRQNTSSQLDNSCDMT